MNSVNEDLMRVEVIEQGEVLHLSGKWWLKVGYKHPLSKDKVRYTTLCFNYKHEAVRNFIGTVIYV